MKSHRASSWFRKVFAFSAVLTFLPVQVDADIIRAQATADVSGTMPGPVESEGTISAFASASDSYRSGDAVVASSVSVGTAYDRIFRAIVSAEGGKTSLNAARDFASASGTWMDTIRWSGPEPAPFELFLVVNLDGGFDGATSASGIAEGSARVEVRDLIDPPSSPVATLLASETISNGESTTLGFNELQSARLTGSGGLYSFNIYFEAMAAVNGGIMEVDVGNTVALLDVQVDDGTGSMVSVVDQITFESGIPLATPSSAVPEPGSCGLLAVGLMGVFVARRRKRS